MQDDGSYGQWGPWSSPGENVASSRGSRYPGELVNAAKCRTMLTLFLFRLSSRATRSGWMTIQTPTLMTTWGIMPMRCERGCWSFFAQCLHLYFSGRWQFWGLLIVIEFRHRWCRPWVWIPPQLWTQVCNDNLDYSVDGLIHFKFQYLRSWRLNFAPFYIFDLNRFKKLADMYGRESDSDESEVCQYNQTTNSNKAPVIKPF